MGPGKPQLSNVKLFPSLFSHKGPEDCWAQVPHADRGTHQLEDVLILGHDGELQGVITAETRRVKPEVTGSGERDQVAGHRLWEGVSACYTGRKKASRSPVLDQTYDLGVCLPNDALPIHLHQPVS